MTDMLTKMARAIADASMSSDPDFTEIARAALMALREHPPFRSSIAAEVWKEGIDAILNQSPE